MLQCRRNKEIFCLSLTILVSCDIMGHSCKRSESESECKCLTKNFKSSARDLSIYRVVPPGSRSTLYPTPTITASMNNVRSQEAGTVAGYFN